MEREILESLVWDALPPVGRKRWAGVKIILYHRPDEDAVTVARLSAAPTADLEMLLSQYTARPPAVDVFTNFHRAFEEAVRAGFRVRALESEKESEKE